MPYLVFAFWLGALREWCVSERRARIRVVVDNQPRTAASVRPAPVAAAGRMGPRRGLRVVGE